MSEVRIVDPAKTVGWDTFVENHPYGWISHLSGWKEILEESFNHMKGYYLVLFQDQAIRAALPLFEVKSWLTGKRLVSIPFATLGDPLVLSTDEMNKLLEAALDLSERVGSSYIEIRTLAASSWLNDERYGMLQKYCHHYLPLDQDIDQMKKAFDRTCVRQRISRAEKSNLRLREAEREPDIKAFYRLYVGNRKRLGLPPQPYIFIKKLWETFSPDNRVSVLLAEQDNITTAGIMVFKFRERVSIEFSAHDETKRNVSPIHFLFWEAIKMYREKGFKILDFGRTSYSNKGLVAFKRRWGAREIDLPIYYLPRNIASRMDGNELSMRYRLVMKMCKNAPFTVLPLIGRMLYRHLG